MADEIQLFVNGNHITPSIGTATACGAIAILSSDGNIIDDPNLNNGSWDLYFTGY